MSVEWRPPCFAELKGEWQRFQGAKGHVLLILQYLVAFKAQPGKPADVID